MPEPSRSIPVLSIQADGLIFAEPLSLRRVGNGFLASIKPSKPAHELHYLSLQSCFPVSFGPMPFPTCHDSTEDLPAKQNRLCLDIKVPGCDLVAVARLD